MNARTRHSRTLVAGAALLVLAAPGQVLLSQLTTLPLPGLTVRTVAVGQGPEAVAFDGINIWGPARDIGMVGFGKNSLTDVAQQVAKRRGRELVPDAEVDKGLFYRSDHLNFARIGVPCAYFKAGNDFLESTESRRRVKLSYTNIHYHQPSDQFDSRWNLAGAADDTRFLLECLLTVANAERQQTWAPGDEFEKAR